MRHPLRFALLFAPTLVAAQAPTILARGANHPRTLAPGGRDEYVLHATGPTFVLGDADQRSVDVVVTVTDSTGRKLVEVDGPARGPERFSFRTERAGTYRLTVAAFTKDSGGEYTLRVPRLEPVAATPSARVEQIMAAYDTASPGAAIGVIRDGKLVFAKGYGRATLEYPVAITSRTPFHVASVSKQFTAFATVLLARDGKLSLDDDVRKFIPELPDLGQRITLRNLLNHTSGIRDQWDLWGMSGGRMDDVITQDDLFRLVTRQRALNFAPGAEYSYSNSGYMLLSKIVERVGGQPFPAFLRQRVFEPLGMRDTRVHDNHQEIVPGRAYSYAQGPRGEPVNAVLSYANSGATSLFTTVEDLARWLRNFRTTTVGGPVARDMMLTRGVRTNGDTLDYALGVSVDRFRGQRRISHNGADAGFRSTVAYFPDLDAGVIVLSNLATFDVDGIANQLVDAWLGTELKAPPPSSVNTAVASATADGARLQALPGEYSAAAGLSVTVSRSGDRLFVQEPGQPRFALRATSDSTFRVDEAGADLTFLRRPASVDTLLLQYNGRTQSLARRAPYVLTAADAALIAGRYRSEEVDATLVVQADSARIIVHRRHADDATLSVTNRDTFRGPWPMQTVRVERDATGRATALLLSTGRVRNVRFARFDTESK